MMGTSFVSAFQWSRATGNKAGSEGLWEQTRREIASDRYIKLLTWLWGFQFFLRLHCRAIPKSDLSTKKTKPNIGKWPESLGVMLEFSSIEGGLFPSRSLTLNVKYPQISDRERLGTRKKKTKRKWRFRRGADCIYWDKHHKDGGDKTSWKFTLVDNSRLALYLTHSRHSPFWNKHFISQHESTASFPWKKGENELNGTWKRAKWREL